MTQGTSLGMGHQNIQFMRSMIDLEADQGPGQRHPDPCIFFANVPNFPQPHLHSVVPTPGCHPIPEHHDNAVFYSMPPHIGVQPQYPVSSLDLAVSAPSSLGNFYLAPPFGTRDFPVQGNHGPFDQFSMSTTHGIVGIPTDSYCRNIPCMDGVRGPFKRKNFEGAPNYQNPYAFAGSSSSVAPISARPAESDVTQANITGYFPLEYGGNGPASIAGHGSLESVRNMASMVGVQSVQDQDHSANHVIQGNYIAPSVQLPGNPWSNNNFGANNGDIGSFAWPQSRNLPYRHDSANGACVQGYQMRAINRGPSGFMHPPYSHGHPNHHHPTQPFQVVSFNHPSHVATSSRRMPTYSVSNTSINPTLDVVDAGPTFLATVPPTGFQLYQPHRRDFLLDPNIRHHNLPHIRILPEDGVAMLEIPGHHEVGDTIDQHRDLRLDIDRMSYEELIVLGEQIGCVGTGLSEEFIRKNLKVRTHTLLPARINLEATIDPKRINFCVVCQTDYECEAKIGTLECGHEYHRDCIKKWLLMKNTCPVCKSPALGGSDKGD